jgi:hypothetical protein
MDFGRRGIFNPMSIHYYAKNDGKTDGIGNGKK